MTDRGGSWVTFRSPSGVFDAGVEYTFSAQVRVAEAGQQARWVGHEPGESNEYPWIGGNVNLVADEWATITATHTFQTATPAGAFAFIEVSGTVNHDIDNILVTFDAPAEPEPTPSVTPTPEPPVCEPVFDLDFVDEELAGWTNNGGASVAVVVDSADAANRVVEVSGRANNWDALRSPAGFIESGVSYTFTAEVRAAVDTTALWIAHEPGESNEYPWAQGGPVDLTGGEWTTVTATRTFDTATPASAFAYLEVPGGVATYEVNSILVEADPCEAVEPPPWNARRSMTLILRRTLLR